MAKAVMNRHSLGKPEEGHGSLKAETPVEVQTSTFHHGYRLRATKPNIRQHLSLCPLSSLLVSLPISLAPPQGSIYAPPGLQDSPRSRKVPTVTTFPAKRVAFRNPPHDNRIRGGASYDRPYEKTTLLKLHMRFIKVVHPYGRS